MICAPALLPELFAETPIPAGPISDEAAERSRCCSGRRWKTRSPTTPTIGGREATEMNSTATAGLLDAALSYLAGGLSLLPCSHETKRPDPDLLPAR